MWQRIGIKTPKAGSPVTPAYNSLQASPQPSSRDSQYKRKRPLDQQSLKQRDLSKSRVSQGAHDFGKIVSNTSVELEFANTIREGQAEMVQQNTSKQSPVRSAKRLSQSIIPPDSQPREPAVREGSSHKVQKKSSKGVTFIQSPQTQKNTGSSVKMTPTNSTKQLAKNTLKTQSSKAPGDYQAYIATEQINHLRGKVDKFRKANIKTKRKFESFSREFKELKKALDKEKLNFQHDIQKAVLQTTKEIVQFVANQRRLEQSNQRQAQLQFNQTLRQEKNKVDALTQQVETLKKKLLAAETAAKASPPIATQSATKQMPASRVAVTTTPGISNTPKVVQQEVAGTVTKATNDNPTPTPNGQKALNQVRKTITTKKSFESSPAKPEAKVQPVAQVPATKAPDTIYSHSKKKSEEKQVAVPEKKQVGRTVTSYTYQRKVIQTKPAQAYPQKEEQPVAESPLPYQKAQPYQPVSRGINVAQKQQQAVTPQQPQKEKVQTVTPDNRPKPVERSAISRNKVVGVTQNIESAPVQVIVEETKTVQPPVTNLPTRIVRTLTEESLAGTGLESSVSKLLGAFSQVQSSLSEMSNCKKALEDRLQGGEKKERKLLSRSNRVPNQ